MANKNYPEKLKEHLARLPIAPALLGGEETLLQTYALHFKPTFQELKTLQSIFIDLKMWDMEFDLSLVFENKMALLQHFKSLHQKYIKDGRHYLAQNPREENQPTFHYKNLPPEDKILGTCPVASEKTLCCNLQTLDAARNCAFDCSYCSIRSFYPDNSVYIENNLAAKLATMEIDPHKIYHIGTGQSSDSLIWGNRANLFDALIDFAQKHPNVLLEFKSKSNNISYFQEKKIPRNIIFTWSLNPDIIIKNEEPMTSNLAGRINAAKTIAAGGNLVGFHFHPMFFYDDYKEDYQDLIDQLTTTFTPSQVAMVSMGTLTFTKKTIRLIRKRNIKSKVLQMDLEETAGKYSHPSEMKAQLFGEIYHMFHDWHGKVFFYLCMEEKKIWQQALGFSYDTNEDLEKAMKAAYADKAQNLP